MSNQSKVVSVAVIGAGLAGAACAASLQRAGLQVTLFDKAPGVGGRMATRRVHWTDELGAERLVALDHGAQHFSARHPRFRALMSRAETAGVVARWRPRVHAVWPAPIERNSFVAVPNMPTLCRHLLDGVPVRLGQQVQRLQRGASGWQIVIADGDTAGPFDQVMLAMPPAQAALLLAGHNDGWADTLMTTRMAPCWTLMAVTRDVDWPWDAAEPDRGPLAWVARNERKPGRSAPPGCATWVAHASSAWSAAHLEESSATVVDALCAALTSLLAAGRPVTWHHASAHRWRYATPSNPALDARECWWDARLGLGVCGDFFGGGNVEAAWRSGDELADTVAAWLEEPHEVAVAA